MSFIETHRGDSPIVLGLPHTGTDLPDDIAAGLNETGRALADTDWHIDQLYADLGTDLTRVRTAIHRYAIDVNRDPGGVSLYPGQNTTTLCPLTDFDGAAIYRKGHEPDADEITRREIAYHAPYHTALRAELERVHALHGFAILFDCHSIRSQISFLFDGTLPDFNLGTNDGTTCDPELEQNTAAICAAAEGYSSVVNGRFKGGWTTRHYGQPAKGVHALQMELSQSTYLANEAPPWTFDSSRAERLQHTLAKILNTLKTWRPT
ncbi:N-formylglutamate deformylase [Ruegeria arenilitoris]|uniref:N-formylglutamate deformylase n=1 Tax=Ruegeria arenilitoris TaxID=1173585 RepID=UPI00147C21F7|nr:N-formylglutamate deformylase [Ruegeria arenilitoris]